MTINVILVIQSLKDFITKYNRYPSKVEMNANFEGLYNQNATLRYIGKRSDYHKHGIPEPSSLHGKCKQCSANIKPYNTFCSSSCSATYNNTKRVNTKKKLSHCVYCNELLQYKGRKYCNNTCYKNNLSTVDNITTIESIHFCLKCNATVANKNRKFCSLVCAMDHMHTLRKTDWLENGTKFGPRSLKKFLVDNTGHVCAKCNLSDWNDQPIPLELEHIDGNSENNIPENLCLLCPNCHAQTPTYKAKNKGNGRAFRRKRYADGKSY